jgi:predicted phage tail protein
MSVKYSSEVNDLQVIAMSKQLPIGLTVAEKVFGLMTVIIGALLIYFTYADPPVSGGQVVDYSFVFIIAGLALVVLGIFLLLARAESD